MRNVKGFIFIFSIIMVLSMALLPAQAASEQYFSSGSEHKTVIELGNYIYYKRAWASYSYNESHYLRAQLKHVITNNIVTDTGRIYSTKAQTIYTEWWNCHTSSTPCSLIAIAYWGS